MPEVVDDVHLSSSDKREKLKGIMKRASEVTRMPLLSQGGTKIQASGE
jgi:hypothetical protein